MIKFNEIIEVKEYRERVIKFFRLPIRLSVSKEKFKSDLQFIKETHNEFYLKMVNETELDFNQLVEEQKTTSPDFSMEDILNPIVREMKNNPKWDEFLRKDYSDVLYGYEGVTSVSGFYKEENDGKHFLSIDLVSANWQSLQSILEFKESYEELISRHTDKLIPKSSKTVRTKISGLLAAKEIMLYNKYLLRSKRTKILESIMLETGINLSAKIPTAFYADEFITEISSGDLLKLQSIDTNKLEERIQKEAGVKVHIRPFTLKWLGIEKSCAKITNSSFEIINLSKDVLLIINKLLSGYEVCEIDFEKINLRGNTRESYLSEIDKKIKNIKGDFK